MRIEIKKRPLKQNRFVPIIVAVRNDGTKTVEVNKVGLAVQGLREPRQPVFRGRLDPGEVRYLTIPIAPSSEGDVMSLNVEVDYTDEGFGSKKVKETVNFQMEGTTFDMVEAASPTDYLELKTEETLTLEPGAVADEPFDKEQNKTSKGKQTLKQKPADEPSAEKLRVETDKQKGQVQEIDKPEMTREEKVRHSFTDEAAELLDL